MPATKPYQPLLLRLFHNVTALLILGAALTGFLVYDSWDRRWGGLGLSTANRSYIDIHGTFGWFLSFIVLPIFVIYCLNAGRKKLIQGNALTQLTQQVGKPIWWVNAQRLTNTLMLVASILAVLSGKFQDENWLPQGQKDHVWYYVHLLGWCGVIGAIALHFLLSAKVGGLPLLLSIIDTQFRPEEHPKHWPHQLQQWFQTFRK